jgi:hypothetical protein
MTRWPPPSSRRAARDPGAGDLTERLDVEEYCISEGWVKVPAGKTLDRRGKPLLIKLKGRVEAFYR